MRNHLSITNVRCTKEQIGALRRTVATAILVAGLFASPVSAQVPATMTGELFTGINLTVTANCNPAGTSTISYTVTGVATGPFPGQFTESGTATLGLQPSPGIAVPVESFTATFRIDSLAAGVEISGTKRLISDPFLATGLGVCTDSQRHFGIAASYSAHIRTSTGLFEDRGKTGVALNDPGLGGTGGQFTEFFLSELLAPVPVPLLAAKVTGGGRIEGNTATFGFIVERREDLGPVSGEWDFTNKETGDIVHGQPATLTVSGNTATFSGPCENRRTNASCTFEVRVEDNGEGANAPPDRIEVTGTGFTGAAGIVSGNIKIH